MILKTAKSICGQLVLPGDKSISHRAAIVAALAEGRSRLTNFSTSADCKATLSCLKQLGISISTENHIVDVEGNGVGRLIEPNAPLDCANSGSTMRMLSGVLAGNELSATLVGDPSLSLRPMQRVIEPLQTMGAQIESNAGKPPLRIVGTRNLLGITFEPTVASAQVKSAVLLAGLHAHGPTTVRERQKTRDHTERMLKWFGAPIFTEPLADGSVSIVISPSRGWPGQSVAIPGDISSASYFIAAAGLLPGSNLEISQVGLNSTRTGFVSWLQNAGFDVKYEYEREICNEPVGSIVVKSEDKPKNGGEVIVVPKESIPLLIDELPLMAVVGSQLAGGIEIRNAKELRFKESDRIKSTVSNLRSMGVEVDEFTDGLAMAGPQVLKGATLDAYGDHRIAMAFAIAALLAEGDSELIGEEAIAVSFPEFFAVLESVVKR